MIEFRLENMTCGHCASAVAAAIREVDPTAHMEVDLLNKKVKVESATRRARSRRRLPNEGIPPPDGAWGEVGRLRPAQGDQSGSRIGYSCRTQP